jgi:hypothetical protein
VDGLSVFQENNPKKLPFFIDPSPLPYPPVSLNINLLRTLDHTAYPFVPYFTPIGPFPDVSKVFSCLQALFLLFIAFPLRTLRPLREKKDYLTPVSLEPTGVTEMS